MSERPEITWAPDVLGVPTNQFGDRTPKLGATWVARVKRDTTSDVLLTLCGPSGKPCRFHSEDSAMSAIAMYRNFPDLNTREANWVIWK